MDIRFQGPVELARSRRKTPADRSWALGWIALVLPALMACSGGGVRPPNHGQAAFEALSLLNLAQKAYAESYGGGFSPDLPSLGPARDQRPSPSAASLVDE